MKSISKLYGVRLTPRESQIRHLIIEGLSTKLIAVALAISEHTVANHRKNILKKKGANSFREMAV